MAKQSSHSHLIVGGMLALFGGGMFLVPWIFMQKMNRNITLQTKPLTRAQVQRGPFVNAGTTDVGADPDWDPVDKKWKGKRHH